MALKYKIEVDDKGTAKVRKFGQSLKGAEKRTNSLKKAFGALAIGFAALKGFQSVINFSKEAIDLFGKQEKAEKKLEAALRSRGIATRAIIEDNKAFASSIQAVTTVGDETVLQLIALAQAFTDTNEQAKQVTKTAIDFAKAADIGITEAVRRIGRAFSGSIEDIAKFAPEIRDLTKAQLAAGDATLVLAKAVKGAASAEIETLTGKLEQLNNTFGDTKEQIGEIILPFLVKGFELFVSAAGKATTALKFFVGAIDIQGNSTTELDDRIKSLTERIDKLGKSEGKVGRDRQLRIRDEKLLVELLAKRALIQVQDAKDQEAAILKQQQAKARRVGGIEFKEDQRIRIQELNEIGILKSELNRLDVEELALKEQLIELEEALNAKKISNAKKAIDIRNQEVNNRLEGASKIIESFVIIQNAFKNDSQAAFDLSKALNIALAIMNTATGATKALAQGGFLGIATMVAVIAAGAAQIATISGTQFKGKRMGGLITGEGGTTSDNIGLRVSPGEAILSGEDIQRGGGFNRIRQFIDTEGTEARAVNITINGNILGTESFVRNQLIPMIQSEGTR